MKDTKQKLARQVEDLEDVRYVMAVLKEVLLDGLKRKSLPLAHSHGLSVLMRCGWLLRRCASERPASTSCSRRSRTCTRSWFAMR